MKKLSDKARLYARSYGQPPYGEEIKGTADLLLQMADKLEEYEDLEEQGKLPRLPCAVGTTVYEIYQFLGEGAWEIDVHRIRLEDLENIGKTVFLSRGEAEAEIRRADQELAEVGEMLTLDEAILHCRERAREDCSKCARDHQQLAEWLEELKMLREKQTPIEVSERTVLRDMHGRPYTIRGNCPVCGSVGLLASNADYCNACGQKLKWDGQLN